MMKTAIYKLNIPTIIVASPPDQITILCKQKLINDISSAKLDRELDRELQPDVITYVHSYKGGCPRATSASNTEKWKELWRFLRGDVS